MSIRVGDPIVRMRALGPDPCGVLPPPTGVNFATGAPSGGVLPAQTVYVFQTWLTPWGETSPSVEQPIDLSAGTQTIIATSTMVPGAIKARVYIGTQPGNQSQFQEVDVSLVTPGSPVVITVDGLTTTAAIPPQINRAFLPDSDGTFVAASTAFSWLNQALRQMIINLGGIPDISGVAWPSGAGLCHAVEFRRTGHHRPMAAAGVWAADYVARGSDGYRGYEFRRHSGRIAQFQVAGAGADRRRDGADLGAGCNEQHLWRVSPRYRRDGCDDASGWRDGNATDRDVHWQAIGA